MCCDGRNSPLENCVTHCALLFVHSAEHRQPTSLLSGKYLPNLPCLWLQSN